MIAAEHAGELLARLARPAAPTTEEWSKRFTRQMETARAIAEPDATPAPAAYDALADVVRELHEQGATKMLSFGERSLARTAKALFTREVATALGRSEQDVLREIDARLATR